MSSESDVLKLTQANFEFNIGLCKVIIKFTTTLKTITKLNLNYTNTNNTK